MTKYTKIANPYIEHVPKSIKVRFLKTNSAQKGSSGNESSESSESNKKRKVEEAFEIEACADLLRVFSPFFAQLLSKNEKVLELSEDDPEAAANLCVRMHSPKRYPVDKWDATHAKLSAKWIVLSVIESLQTFIDDLLEDVIESLEEDKRSLFLEIKEVVLTHTVYQDRKKLLTFNSNSINNKMAIALILSNDKQRYTNEESAGLELNSQECSEFARHLRNRTRDLLTTKK